ncbi:uncharacterized protein N7459_005413 [Penicillium hispanicum]|uniref:uncharacterized protein n=1 Tax=Penicillium hispanicum TaxID=1080232 RepID=UPI00254088BB|nr:uncharacterized protein N7459_005413 [Penicillium hispanicum]KAJ5585613.1 hypothetical protein N7459_005413 [Penicillium hispanicum]
MILHSKLGRPGEWLKVGLYQDDLTSWFQKRRPTVGISRSIQALAAWLVLERYQHANAGETAGGWRNHEDALEGSGPRRTVPIDDRMAIPVISPDLATRPSSLLATFGLPISVAH